MQFLLIAGVSATIFAETIERIACPPVKEIIRLLRNSGAGQSIIYKKRPFL